MGLTIRAEKITLEDSDTEREIYQPKSSNPTEEE